MKITIVGAGLVGTTTCQNICQENIADEIVLVDIHPNVEGKVVDIMQSRSLYNFKTMITPLHDKENDSESYSNTQHSDIGIITCGLPRKPGMTREELIDINSKIVIKVAQNLVKYSPNIILIVVTNPVDILTSLLHETLSIPSQRIIGMGGILDTARYVYYLRHYLNLTYEKIKAFVIGSHTDTHMIPLVNHTTIDNNNLTDIVDKDTIDKIVNHTKNGGAIITQIQGYSAGYAPAAAITTLVKSIVNDSKKILCCSTLLNGLFGVKNICIGLPVIIGKNGIEMVVDMNFTKEETNKLLESINNLKLVFNNWKNYT